MSKLTGMLWLSLSIGLVAVGILLRPSAPAVEVLPTPTLPAPAVWYSPTPTVEPTPTPTVESGILYTVRDGDSWWTIVNEVCSELGHPQPNLQNEVERVNMNLTHNSVWTNDVLHPGDIVAIGCDYP